MPARKSNNTFIPLHAAFRELSNLFSEARREKSHAPLMLHSQGQEKEKKNSRGQQGRRSRRNTTECKKVHVQTFSSSIRRCARLLLLLLASPRGGRRLSCGRTMMVSGAGLANCFYQDKIKGKYEFCCMYAGSHLANFRETRKVAAAAAAVLRRPTVVIKPQLFEFLFSSSSFIRKKSGIFGKLGVLSCIFFTFC